MTWLRLLKFKNLIKRIFEPMQAMVYVNPTHNIMSVKSAANNKYGTTNYESSFKENESIALLREYVKSISPSAIGGE